jgi:hypothetical protein
MLTIHFGYLEEACKSSDSYFKGSFEEEWFDDPLVREMILDIDKSEVESFMRIKSPVFDYINYDGLSGGVKTLIMMYKLPGFIARSTAMGDNCAKWIIKISELVDCSMTFEHGLVFGEGIFDYSPFRVYIDNFDITVNNIRDFYYNHAKYMSLQDD